MKAEVPVLVARHAMATRFEIVLHGDDPRRLRAAGEEALEEIERLEARLSLYRTSSEVAHLNARAHLAPVRVTPALFHLLERARNLSAETLGAFDITIAPVVRCWGFMGGSGSKPADDALARAKELVGMHWIDLDAQRLTVRFQREGVMIDLGAIGKGFAIDKAAEVLREAGVSSALVHGGTSSAYAVGRQPNGDAWKIAVTSPNPEAAPLAVLELADQSLSVSAVWGKSFSAGNETFGHVIDPRSGVPVRNAMLAAVVLPSATDGDALSTALLTDPGLLDALVQGRPGLKCIVAVGAAEHPTVTSRGMDGAAENL